MTGEENTDNGHLLPVAQAIQDKDYSNGYESGKISSILM